MLDGPTIGDKLLQVETDDDGNVRIGFGAAASPKRATKSRHGENLAEQLAPGDCATIAEEVLEGIQQDIRSRAEWEDTYNRGLDLLGLKIEQRDKTKGDRGSVSRVRDPLLLEQVVKAQSLARGELMPADGPCKGVSLVPDTLAIDELAEHLERDMNAYLTVGAPEYYPDMDRGLFGLFYSGNLFRKVYKHPIRRRPCVESIAVDDLIVSQDATDLLTAPRVTHRSYPSRVILRRMQLAGYWLDDELPPAVPDMAATSAKEREITGQGSPISPRPEDQPYTVLECTTDLDLAPYGIEELGQPDGLPLPYTVTVEEGSRRMLAIRRAWDEGDPDFLRQLDIVHYGMVPGFGFLCFGYLHLLGNQVSALTACLRILTDLGMYSCFPGGMKAKGVRMGSSEVSPDPGEWVDVDPGPMDDLRKALMPMPYNLGGAPVFLEMMGVIRQATDRLSAAPEIQTGEGRTNVPVGTIMAMVEQATQVTSAVHKRLHTAQARELQLLKNLIADDPELLNRVIPNPSRRWSAEVEFDSVDIAPASDPNVPSHVHRVLQATALVQVAGMNPDIYDRVAVHKRAWDMVGIGDVDSLIHPPAQQGAPPPDPRVIAAQMKAQADAAKLQQQDQENQRKAANEAVQAQQQHAQTAAELQDNQAERESRERIAAMQQQTEMMKVIAQAHSQHAQMANDRAGQREQRAHETQRAAMQHQHNGAV